jgi:gelsolin
LRFLQIENFFLIQDIMAVSFIDSNIALFGSDLEHQVKKTAAQSEKQWLEFKKQLLSNVPQSKNLWIWRIEKFHVVPWPQELYGQFYNGDSYIVCNVEYANGRPTNYDLHFWIGSKSTVDEAGAAAYKTVELDTFLDNVPVQHRELQTMESDLFKSYFKNFSILEGGIESGFHHVPLPEEGCGVKFYHVVGHTIKPFDEALAMGVTEDDVYIMDLGKKVYVYEGANSSHLERYTAAYAIERMNSHRAELEVVRDRELYCEAVVNLGNKILHQVQTELDNLTI